jgi:hypothetical protein
MTTKKNAEKNGKIIKTRKKKKFKMPNRSKFSLRCRKTKNKN